MRVRYLGPSDSFNGIRTADKPEFDLTENQIAQLRRTGHRFEPADGRQKLPEPAAAPPPTDEQAALLTGEKPA